MIRMRPVVKARKKTGSSPGKTKPRPTSETIDRLDEYLEGNIDEPMRWLSRFWNEQQSDLHYRDLVALAVLEPAAEGIFKAWYQEYSKLLETRMVPLWQQSMEAAVKTSPFLPREGFVFNGTEEAVLRWMKERTGDLITVVTRDQVEAVRYVVLEGRARYLGAGEMAKYIRPIVGLNRPQAAANLRLYESVKQKLQADHPRMKPESVEKKAREAAAKYAAKQQKYRAMMIAKTEMAFAYNYGEDAAVKQAMAMGLLPRMRRIWRTGAEHICSACADLEGADIGMEENEFFQTTVGHRAVTVVLPPLHPNCQCVIEYVEELGEDGKVIWDQPPANEREIQEVPELILPEYEDMRMQEYGTKETPRITPEVRRTMAEEMARKERTQPYLDNMTESCLRKGRNHGARDNIENGERFVAEQMGIGRDEAAQMINEGLETLVDNSDFAIRISPENLSAVLEDGYFRNQYETGTSEGSLDPEWIRKRHEWYLFGVPDKNSQEITDADRPVYGMLVPRYDETNNIIIGYYLDGPGTQYGEITVVLDKNSVINNASVTLGDSLNYRGSLVGTEANNPSYSGSCQGNEGALALANLSGGTASDAASTLIDITTRNRKEDDDRYVELQLHGQETHSVANIARVFIPEKTVQEEKAKGLIEKLDHVGIEWIMVRKENSLEQELIQTGGHHYIQREFETLKDKKARKAYEKYVREYDAEIIARNTGFSVEEIVQVKRHVFFDKHQLYESYGRLEPDYDMAVAWKRLREGDFLDRDILLLHHELLESSYEKEYNLSIEQAHALASKTYDWSMQVEMELGLEGEPDGLL